MVVTLTLAVPLPLAREFGLTVQVVLAAENGKEQDKLTCDTNPFWAVTEIALVKLPVWPALMVCAVVPVDVMVKSGGGVTVKLKGAEVPPGAGSTT